MIVVEVSGICDCHVQMFVFVSVIHRSQTLQTNRTKVT